MTQMLHHVVSKIVAVGLSFASLISIFHVGEFVVFQGCAHMLHYNLCMRMPSFQSVPNMVTDIVMAISVVITTLAELGAQVFIFIDREADSFDLIFFDEG
jgi:hypothetical protein